MNHIRKEGKHKQGYIALHLRPELHGMMEVHGLKQLKTAGFDRCFHQVRQQDTQPPKRGYGVDAARCRE